MADNEQQPRGPMAGTREGDPRQESRSGGGAGVVNAFQLQVLIKELSEQNQLSAERNALMGEDSKQQEMQTKLLGGIKKSFDQWFKIAQADRLQGLGKGLGKKSPLGFGDAANDPNAPEAKPVGRDMGPDNVGWIKRIAAIAGAASVAAFGFTTWEGFKTGVNKLIFGPMKLVFAPIDKTMKALGVDIKALPENLKNWSKDFVKNLKEKFKFSFKFGDKEYKSSQLGQFFDDLWGNLKEKVGKLRTAIVGFWNEKIVAPFERAQNWFKELLSGKETGTAGGAKEAKPGWLGQQLETFKAKFGTLGGWVKSFLGVIGKILQPIAIVFSAIDGLKESEKQFDENETKENERQAIETVGGFVAGFTGSFIGGFINFVKNAMLWVVKKIFGEGVVDPETGEFRTDVWWGRMLKNVEEFDAAKMITDGINWLFELFANAVLWIKEKGQKIAEFFGMNAMSGEEENKLAQMKVNQAYSPAEYDALEAAANKTQIKDWATLSDDQIAVRSRIAAKDSEFSEAEMRMLMKRMRAEARAGNVALPTGNMPLKTSQLKEATDEMKSGQIVRSTPPTVVSAPQTTVNAPTNNTSIIQSPLSPAGANSVDAGANPF